MNKSLQDKVKQDLEKKGVLSKVRNLFKEKIYESIKAQQKNLPISSSNKNKILETKSGQICCTLVQDFLESFGLNLSLSIFLPEAQLEQSRENIQILENALGARSTAKNPLIFEVIQRALFPDDEEDGSIQEDIGSTSEQSFRDHFTESGGNSQGYDQSANSLVMNEFDYVENVRRAKAK